MSVDQHGRKTEHSILTYTGRQFWPLQPEPGEVNILDIAHALSNVCRFTGHVRDFYSVAQHSVLVSLVLRDDPKLALWGLLHDATEAYIADMASPVKVQFPEYKVVEHRLMRAIAERFGLEGAEPPEVKRADLILRATERRDLMPSSSEYTAAHFGGETPLSLQIEPWSPRRARAEFMDRYRQLTKPVPAAFQSCGIDGCCGFEHDLATLSTIRIAEDFANREKV